MARGIVRIISLAVLVIAGWTGLYLFEKRFSSDAAYREEHARRLEAEARAEKLREVVSHLQSEQRVAKVLVLDQEKHGDQLKTTLLFQEMSKTGQPLPPKIFKIDGKEAHIDAMIVKFKGHYVEEKDPLRGKSIALFTKLFDNKQSPEMAYRIDEPGHIPAIYQGADAKVSEFEQQLWRDFWKLAEDEQYRERMGVDVVHGKSVWWRFEPGNIYTLNMQPNADLVLRTEPMEPILYEAMKRQWAEKLDAIGKSLSPATAPGQTP